MFFFHEKFLFSYYMKEAGRLCHTYIRKKGKMGRIIINGNQCYEIDEECMRQRRCSGGGKNGEKEREKGEDSSTPHEKTPHRQKRR
jgi:hypothetical protein